MGDVLQELDQHAKRIVGLRRDLEKVEGAIVNLSEARGEDVTDRLAFSIWVQNAFDEVGKQTAGDALRAAAKDLAPEIVSGAMERLLARQRELRSKIERHERAWDRMDRVVRRILDGMGDGE